jgi:hypothetical protein
MKGSKFWFIISLFSIIALIFGLGWAIGNRSYITSIPDTVAVRYANGFENTSLTSVKFLKLNTLTSGEVRQIGEIIYKEENLQVEILVRITNMPSLYSSEPQIIYPEQYKVYIAEYNNDGTNYDQTEIGTVLLDPARSNLRSAFFSTNFKKKNKSDFAKQYNRVIFWNESGASTLPPFDYNLFPSELKSKPSPYIWSE